MFYKIVKPEEILETVYPDEVEGLTNLDWIWK